MAKDKNKKKNEKVEQSNDQVVEAVIVEEEVIVVSDGEVPQEDNENYSNDDNGFGAPDLPTPKKSAVLIILITAGILGLMYLSKQSIVAATVNGRPIYRYQLIKRLEKDFGKQAYENMLREELLNQEAERKAIIVTQSDIDNEFKKIDQELKSQGTSLDDALKQQNLTKADVTDSIRFQILATKLVADKITVSEEEIKQYTDQNKDFLPKDQSAEQIRATVEEYIKSQKEAQAVDALLNELKGKAQINQILEL